MIEKGLSMKSWFTFLTLGLFLVAHQPLFSENNKRSFHTKNGTCKYRQYLKDTVWIVPPSTLLAYEYLNGQHVSVLDQTVWVISNYDQGYFFGDSYTNLNGSPSSQRKLVGSITPRGDVYISFYPLSDNVQDTDIVNGIGKFVKHQGKYIFVMQMNSAQNTLTGLSHWSYMISVKPEDYFYRHLPGVNISVPAFIKQFD